MLSSIDVGLSGSLAPRRSALQEMLGSRYQVAAGLPDPAGVMVVDAVEDVARLRSASAALRIIVLLEAADDPTPVEVVERIEAGADVCLVAPGLAGLAAHIRALAAHRPALEAFALDL
jgi:hypothetical protein